MFRGTRVSVLGWQTVGDDIVVATYGWQCGTVRVSERATI